ncbi:hypothetical protein [Tychonema sp. BBK16]|uniref:hypothetical protein n=1 Tax=Tychonema sp. BBK16 TaxID=2699888 RepID=UPI001F488B00|nr:hypothetical protein [Tychonema sp. BBK16]MCF6374528.1 hypothetical protein [Tychonema sp. BBK16]
MGNWELGMGNWELGIGNWEWVAAVSLQFSHSPPLRQERPLWLNNPFSSRLG